MNRAHNKRQQNILTYEDSDFHRITGISWNQMTDDKGIRGEYEAYQILKEHADASTKFLFHIYLPLEKGKLTEIDILVITTHGIIVIENKNMNGNIDGHELVPEWEQWFEREDKAPIIHNPVMQNATHIRALQKVLGMHVPFYSLILFGNSANLKGIDVSSKNAYVTYRGYAHTALNKILSSTTKQLGENDIERYYQKLLPYALANHAVRERHLRQLGSNDHALVIHRKVCPICGRKIVQRELVNTQKIRKRILCCSNYPGCCFQEEI